MFKKTLFLAIIISILVVSGCKKDVYPKPHAYLRLDYKKADYKPYESKHHPFLFNINAETTVKDDGKAGITILYPKMKASIYITYHPIKNNLKDLLRDSQKLTYEHVIKADDIIEQPYINLDDKVYGMFYQVNGDAATNSQFYVTDSIHHFVNASLYFYAKPNFDSILPGVNYVKNDMQIIMETFKWKH